MSDILVVSAKHESFPTLGRHFFTEMQSGKHRMTVMVAPDHLQVIVHNASNRVWRGLGRRFETAEAAIGHYKTAEVRAMIRHAIEQSRVAA